MLRLYRSGKYVGAFKHETSDDPDNSELSLQL